jgi:hypothetical protein
MAKNNQKKVSQDDNSVKDENKVVNPVNEQIILNEVESILNDKIYLNEISITDLIAYEKACALVCKKYEISARINETNDDKFKQYNNCYNIIFKEIENRIIKLKE